jgi:uncharacterized protein YegL
MRKTLMAWLAAFLLAGGAGAQEVYLDNVVIVLDASGSMCNNMRGANIQKLAAAKAAIKEVIKTIPATTQVGLLVFNGKADGWAYPLGPRDDEKMLSAVASLTADGGTPLGAYMKTGADKLLESRKSQYGYGSYRLLIVTDGEASDPKLVEAYTPDIIARGIVTDVIGVDMASDHTLATRVHSYRRANDPDSLRQAIREVFAEVGKTFDGKASEDAFAELAGFPTELALATISALASSGNQPIGEQPAGIAEPEPVKTADQPAPALVQHPKSAENNSSGWNTAVIIVIFIVIASSLRRRRRRR